jgi:hypothetical protein
LRSPARIFRTVLLPQPDGPTSEMAEYFPIDLPFPRALPIKTTDEFGAYARRIYANLGLGSGG